MSRLLPFNTLNKQSMGKNDQEISPNVKQNQRTILVKLSNEKFDGKEHKTRHWPMFT